MRIPEDLRCAFRALWKDPGFAIPAILALALSIGANTSVFTVVKSVLLAPLKMRRPGLWTRTALFTKIVKLILLYTQGLPSNRRSSSSLSTGILTMELPESRRQPPQKSMPSPKVPNYETESSMTRRARHPENEHERIQVPKRTQEVVENIATQIYVRKNPRRPQKRKITERTQSQKRTSPTWL